jgi:hypothetical protein
MDKIEELRSITKNALKEKEFNAYETFIDILGNNGESLKNFLIGVKEETLLEAKKGKYSVWIKVSKYFPDCSHNQDYIKILRKIVEMLGYIVNLSVDMDGYKLEIGWQE